MQIRQFEYVMEIARQGSIKRAAEKLYISQQALSETLKLLEEKLGFPIFQRTNKGVVPTANGEKVLQDIEEILSKVYGWGRLKEKQEAHIVIQYVLDNLLLDKDFTDLLYGFPNMNIQLETGAPGDILEEVASGKPCLALLCLETHTKNYQNVQRFIKSSRSKLEKIEPDDIATMKILLQPTICPETKDDMIDMNDIAGKTLVAIKDLLQIETMQKFHQDKRITVRALPRSVKAMDLVAHDKNMITCLPYVIAKNDKYVKNGILTIRQLLESKDEDWHCYLLYNVEYEEVFQRLIQEIKNYFFQK